MIVVKSDMEAEYLGTIVVATSMENRKGRATFLMGKGGSENRKLYYYQKY